MKSYKITRFQGPVELVEHPIPELTGTDVLVRITHAGVCHSDLHIADGYYDLGDGKTLDLSQRGIQLPRTMGHEILGVVERGGPDAGELPVGETRLINPWIGCGECPTCKAGRENHCMVKPESLGVFRDGGYADYVVVPHSRHLVEIGDVDPAVATPYSCSGVTVYSALKKALPIEDGEWLVVMGAGGLGHMAVTIARGMGIENVISCDVDDAKLASAKESGAAAAVNTRDADALDQIKKITGGGPRAVVDTVGAEATANLGIASLLKGGRYVIVGLYGGQITLSLPTLPLRAVSIIGSYVGNIHEIKELMGLIRAGKVKPIPYATRPMEQVAQTLEDLRNGKIVGRVVLTN